MATDAWVCFRCLLQPSSTAPAIQGGEAYNDRVKIITTHMSADFDAFASAVCAVRLYPDHRVLFPGSMELAVRSFRAETALPFPEVKLKEARRHRFEHAVVLDTPDPARLGEVWDMIQQSGCPRHQDRPPRKKRQRAFGRQGHLPACWVDVYPDC